jgi:hypothetical protein
VGKAIRKVEVGKKIRAPLLADREEQPYRKDLDCYRTKNASGSIISANEAYAAIVLALSLLM